MIKIWRGFHYYELLEIIKGALEKKFLLILVPPSHKDFSFIPHLPEGPLELIGDWSNADELLQSIENEARVPRKQVYSQLPILGVFTSGTSSGYSRLVLYSLENLVASLNSIRSLFDCSRIQRIFCFPQPTHVFGLALGYVQALLFDAKLVIGEGKYKRETQKLWFDSVDSKTLTLGAPAHFSDLIETTHQNAALREVPKSYASICGGAPVSRQLWFQQREFLRIENPSIGYGASEASPGVTHLAPGLAPLVDGEIGSPLPSVNARIIEGRGLEFDGPNLCLAYIEKENLHFPKSIVLGDWIENGGNGLVFRGRFSSLINRGGQKFSLERIESILKARLSIDCIAVAVPEQRLGEELGLLIRGNKFEVAPIKREIEKEFGFSTDHILINWVSELPLNQNFKPDRHRAKLLIHKPQLPAPVSEFFNWLPHREEAIWIDSVLSVEESTGQCEVNIDQRKNYFDQVSIRPSSYIEWMAQSYGFVKAYQEISAASTSLKPKRVFLVGVKNFECIEKSDAKKFLVSVRQTHQLGPMALVSAQVQDADGRVIAKGELKLFAE